MTVDFTSLGLSARASARLVDVLRIGAVLPGDPSEADAALLAPNWPDPSRAFGAYRVTMARIGPCALVRAWRDEAGVVNVETQDAKRRIMLIRVGFDSHDRVRLRSHSRPLPEGVTIRPVAPHEYAALAALERAAPLQMGDGVSYRIFRPHFADLIALQGGGKLWAAWRGTRAIGLRGLAFKTVAVEGTDQMFLLSQFAVVHPEERGANLLQCFGRYESEEATPLARHFIAHMDEGNAAVMAAFGGEEANKLNWRRTVKMLLFACAAGGREVGRAATPTDAERIAALMNDAHGGKALYTPQTADSVAEKLGRAPHAYGFADVLMTSRACVGVWFSGEEIEDTRAGVTTRRRLTTVVDYGFAGADGARDLLALIEAWRSRAAAKGHSHLVLYTSDEAPEYATLSPHATFIDSFLLRTSLAEPPTGPGLYPDALFI